MNLLVIYMINHWHILFANDIDLIDDNLIMITLIFEFWRQTLEIKWVELSMTKIEYIKCNFSISKTGIECWVKIDEQYIPTSTYEMSKDISGFHPMSFRLKRKKKS